MSIFLCVLVLTAGLSDSPRWASDAVEPQAAAIEGAWTIIDPAMGKQVGTMTIKREREGNFSIEGAFPSAGLGGLPPAWLGSGRFSSSRGNYTWASFDGREGRTAVRMRGDRLVLEIRCLKGTCTDGEFEYEAIRQHGSEESRLPVPAIAAPAVPFASVPPSVPAEKRPHVWQEFRSVAGAFRMEFPGVPDYRPAKVSTEAAGVIDYHQWGVTFDSDAYFASYGDFPAGHIESKGIVRMLRDVVDGQVRSSNDGTLLSEVVVSVAGHPARDTIVVAKEDGRSFTVRARTILVGSRLYQLFYLTDSRLEPGDAERFLNSFRLIDR